MKALKAIPTMYQGVLFRSKLEAKYARAFDRLGIVWEYEGRGFQFDDGTFYCPDFYMPEIETLFEVKGIMDDASATKVRNLADEVLPLGGRVVVGHPDGSMTVFQGDFGSAWDGEGGIISGCALCGRRFFLTAPESYKCPACGEYDGDRHLKGWWENLFEAAGWQHVR